MTDVVIETGKRRVFASAREWPGWCRAGRDEAQALEALAAYAERYAAVARRAHMKPPAAGKHEVVERLDGDATTDFGAPSQPAAAERKATPKELERAAVLLEAAWATFDAVVKRAPAQLRKGPRGGGRDRDDIVSHVVEAQRAYLPKVGVRTKGPAAEVRKLALEAIRSGEDGKWPRLYAARRMAWHVLDHAWEIEDRSADPAD